MSDSGSEVFVDVDAARDFLVTPGGGNSGTAALGFQGVVKQSQLDNFFINDSASIDFTVGPGGTTYTVTRVSDGAPLQGGDPLQTLVNVPYVPGEPIVFEGAHIELSGTPANGDAFAVAIAPPSKLDLLSVVEKLATGLSTLGDSQQGKVALEELIADTLFSLENALTNVSSTEAKIGARLNSVDNANEVNADLELISREVLSDIEDLDFTQAISDLSRQTFILEAAQRSFTLVSNLSLFNFLR